MNQNNTENSNDQHSTSPAQREVNAKRGVGYDYIDIHSHLYFPDFDLDRDQEILSMKEAGIATITVGTNFESSQKAVELTEKHDNLFACVGQHPGDITLETEFDNRLKELALNKKVVAIGECGLDYFRLSGEPEEKEKIKEKQKNIFKSHIELAVEINKPLMLHIRSSLKTQDAYEETLDILESCKNIRGNVHFFVGSLDILKRFLAVGFTVSFTGVLTFTHDYDELVKYVPLDKIMAETDAPFVAPVPYRGKRNSPLYVPEVVKVIASIRGENLEMVQIALRDNAVRYFSLS